MTAEAWDAARRRDVDRAAAEQRGVLLGGATELVRLDEIRPAGLPRGAAAVERPPNGDQHPRRLSALVGHEQGPQPRDHRVEAVRSNRPARSARPLHRPSWVDPWRQLTA